LFFHGEQRVISDLGCGVSGSIGVLQSHKALFAGILLQFLMVGALNEVVDPSLAEQIRLLLFCCAAASVARATVHPVDAVDSFAVASSLELVLDFLLGAFFLELANSLLGAFPLFEGLLFLVVDTSLILHQARMP